MSQATERSADFRLGTPYAVATTSSSTRLELPTGMGPGDGHTWWSADGEDVYVRFGDGTVTVAANGVSTVVSEAITAAGSTVAHMHLVADGPAVQPKIPAGATHFARISAGTTGFLRFGVAQGAGKNAE